MVKLQIRYKKEYEKEEIIKILSDAATVTNISKPYKSGDYCRIYLDVE